MIKTYTFRQFFQSNITANSSGFLLPTSGNRPLILNDSKLYGRDFNVLTARSIISASLVFDSVPSELYRVGYILTPIADLEMIRRMTAAQTFYSASLVDVETDQFCLTDEVFCGSLLTSQYSGSTVAGASKTNDFGLLQPVFQVTGGQNLYLWLYLDNGSNTGAASGSLKVITSIALTVEVTK